MIKQIINRISSELKCRTFICVYVYPKKQNNAQIHAYTASVSSLIPFNLLFSSASVFGMTIGIITISNSQLNTKIILPLYLTFFSALLFLVEIYIFSCFRFFGFLLKNWGKSFTYLFLGVLIFPQNDKLTNITSIVFIVLAIIYFVFSFTVNGIARPLAQTGSIALTTSSSDYYIEA